MANDAHGGTGTIGKYTTSGATVNAALVSGLSWPMGLAVDGDGFLYVAHYGRSAIGKYTTSGDTVNASFIPGLNLPTKVVLDGQGNLYISTVGDGTVGKYTTSGAVLNATLIVSPTLPAMLGVNKDGNLLVALYNAYTVGEYTPSGTLLNYSFISGVRPSSLVVIIPEASTLNVVGSGLNPLKNTFSLNVTNPSGVGLIIEASQDLKSWTPVATNAATQSWNVDVPALSPSNTLYRARTCY